MPDGDRLDRLLAEAGERWRATQPPAPRIEAVWRVPAARSRWGVTSLLVAAGLVALLGTAALNLGGAPTPSSSSPAPSSEVAGPTGLPPSPELTPWPGFELPSELDGTPVLVGDAAIAAFQASTDATRMLVGGWIKGGEVRSCPIDFGSDPFYVCDGVFLYARPFSGPSAMVLYRGSVPVLFIPETPAGSILPVVFVVHTHDSACAAPRTDCLLLPVAEQLRWAGPIGPIQSPTSTQLPDGLAKQVAERIAVYEALGAPQRAGDVTVVTSRAGHYAEVGRPGSTDVAGDRWVWAVVVSGHFTTPHCQPPTACLSGVQDTLIVLDYVTGQVLIQETPAPSS